MSRWNLVALAFVAACTGSSHTRTGYAADNLYHDEIQTCLSHTDCATLCMDLFRLDDSDTVDRVKIMTHDQYGAKVACEFSGATGDFSLDVDFDDWGDDECDGNCDDSGDDGSDDGSMGDDGGSDDGSGSGDGSDDGGGDGSDDGGGDGSGRIAPHRIHINPTSATPRR